MTPKEGKTMYPFNRMIFAIYLVTTLLIIGGCSQEENPSSNHNIENITKSTEEPETKTDVDTPLPTKEPEKKIKPLSELRVHYIDVGQPIQHYSNIQTMEKIIQF